eukprot:2272805-Pyramimonas_sp.AAC.1
MRSGESLLWSAEGLKCCFYVHSLCDAWLNSGGAHGLDLRDKRDSAFPLSAASFLAPSSSTTGSRGEDPQGCDRTCSPSRWPSRGADPAHAGRDRGPLHRRDA